MKIERTEVVWLESKSDYTAHDLAEMSGLPVELLNELIDCGALPVVRETAREHDHVRFAKESIALVRAARRLRDDFELDINGLAVALSLQRRMLALEAELAEARARGFAIFDRA